MRLTSIVATLVLSAGTALLVNTVRAEDAAVTRQRMIDLGRQHKTAEALYLALRERAHGGRRLAPSTMPDWSGFTRVPAAESRLTPISRAAALPPPN